MSNGFITVAIAHDLTCKRGKEWVFHGLAKPYDVHVSLESPIDARDKELLDKDMEKLREAKEQSQDDFNSCGCINDMVNGRDTNYGSDTIERLMSEFRIPLANGK